jgi:geranylgeranyl diphosphate synthase type II
MKNNLKDKNNLVKTYINGLLSVCEGQALDIEFESRPDVSIDEYTKMIYLKTAYMIGLSSEIGGILSNLDEDEIIVLKNFGDSIGMAYQVQDDLLELFSDSDSMNKSLDSDFTLNKKTFLWTYTEPRDRGELNNLLNQFKDDKKETIKKLRNFIIRYGIKENAESFISNKINYANSLLENFDKDTDFLYYYSNLIFNRGN